MEGKLKHFILDDRRIWLRAFYGFDPESAGYIGFTNPGDQATMLDRMASGDLVLIYGAVEDLTRKDLRAQALGFLEIETTPCVDQDRMSDKAIKWKVERGFQERWTNGIIVRRAWHVTNRVGIRTIAPKAYRSEHRFERTTRAILLEPEERLRALSHHVRETNVYGEKPIDDGEQSSGTFTTLLRPSKGIPPRYGKREHQCEDGENATYLMTFNGRASLLLGSEVNPTLCVAKVGRSNDTKRRLGQVNCGFPVPSQVGWRVIQTHKFENGATAHDYEDALKSAFEKRFRSLGGEFFLGRRAEMEAEFTRVCSVGKAVILGAAAKAQGAK
ncbi:hypothetical protein [Sphingomicrobium nitratireducens]|uniref:hypothetical protein n=1 Tax=Sphingomicrobium nitratireducens TaxID=2964666 RepID=UPI002240AA5F|nr:hypothetical protein [Sphingomicrobium nitratireducens]